MADTTTLPPDDWTAALDRARTDLDAGRFSELEDVLAEIEADAAELEAEQEPEPEQALGPGPRI